MKPNLVVRIVTFSAFAILMSSFVAYKAGAFEGYLGENDATLDSPVKDSVVRAPEMMAPSSKDAMIFEPRTEVKEDSPAQQQNNSNTSRTQSNANASPQQNEAPSNNSNGPAKSPTYMGSSKSGPVFTPKTDTSKPK